MIGWFVSVVAPKRLRFGKKFQHIRLGLVSATRHLNCCGEFPNSLDKGNSGHESITT